MVVTKGKGPKKRVIAFDEVRGDRRNNFGNQRQGQMLDVFFFQGQD